MPQETYKYNPITTLIVLILLFCAFALFHWIIPMLRTAGAAYCPADAVKEVKELPGVVTLETAGGGGVMLEVARILCK